MDTAVFTPEARFTLAELEDRYPPRPLPESARVTRFGPSPTGVMHIGGLYTSLVSRRVAHQSGGVFFLRIEDTDKKREVAGTVDLIKGLGNNVSGVSIDMNGSSAGTLAQTFNAVAGMTYTLSFDLASVSLAQYFTVTYDNKTIYSSLSGGLHAGQYDFDFLGDNEGTLTFTYLGAGAAAPSAMTARAFMATSLPNSRATPGAGGIMPPGRP